MQTSHREILTRLGGRMLTWRKPSTSLPFLLLFLELLNSKIRMMGSSQMSSPSFKYRQLAFPRKCLNSTRWRDQLITASSVKLLRFQASTTLPVQWMFTIQSNQVHWLYLQSDYTQWMKLNKFHMIVQRWLTLVHSVQSWIWTGTHTSSRSFNRFGPYMTNLIPKTMKTRPTHTSSSLSTCSESFSERRSTWTFAAILAHTTRKLASGSQSPTIGKSETRKDSRRKPLPITRTR